MVKFIRSIIKNRGKWSFGIGTVFGIIIAIGLFISKTKEDGGGLDLEGYIVGCIGIVIIGGILSLPFALLVYLLVKALAIIFYFQLKNLNHKEIEEEGFKEKERLRKKLSELLTNSENRDILEKYKYDWGNQNYYRETISFINNVREIRNNMKALGVTEFKDYFKSYCLPSYKDPFIKYVIKYEVIPFYIKRCETAGQYEEAAQVCEYIGNLEEAGRLRKLTRTKYVKTSSVNINQLIPQLKEMVNYKCPNCGSGIDIHSKTTTDGLKFCSHCGSGLNLNLVSDFIKSLL